jgi:hypothetical protein
MGDVYLEPAGAAYTGPDGNVDADPLAYAAHTYCHAHPNGYCDGYAHTYVNTDPS